jgi:hypothetical protein
MKKTNDNVYLNIVINQFPTAGNTSTPAVYDENLTIAILDDCSKYYCSVIRFVIPLAALPILIFPLLTTQANPNISSLIIGIQYLGVNYPVNVVYQPATFRPPPTAGAGPIYFTNGQSTDVYYWVYSVALMINMFNTTINSAMIAAGLGAVTSPYYSFDPTTQLISLTVTQDFLNTGAILYHNDQADNFLASFNLFYHGNNQPGGFEFSHILTPTPPGSPVGGPYVYIEDYISIDLWFSLRKLLITTDTIPIVKEISPSQNPNEFGINTGITSSLPIITDFVPQLSFSNEARSIAYYYPTSQYRLVDMISNTPLQRINLRIYWSDKFGNLFPVEISVFQQASVKLAFIKKDLYKNSNLLTMK